MDPDNSKHKQSVSQLYKYYRFTSIGFSVVMHYALRDVDHGGSGTDGGGDPLGGWPHAGTRIRHHQGKLRFITVNIQYNTMFVPLLLG